MAGVTYHGEGHATLEWRRDGLRGELGGAVHLEKTITSEFWGGTPLAWWATPGDPTGMNE